MGHQILQEHGRVDIILIDNSFGGQHPDHLANSDNISQYLTIIGTILKFDGMVVIQTNDLSKMISNRLFDLFYLGASSHSKPLCLVKREFFRSIRSHRHCDSPEPIGPVGIWPIEAVRDSMGILCLAIQPPDLIGARHEEPRARLIVV